MVKLGLQLTKRQQAQQLMQLLYILYKSCPQVLIKHTDYGTFLTKFIV